VKRDNSFSVMISVKVQGPRNLLFIPGEEINCPTSKTSISALGLMQPPLKHLSEVFFLG
jgi:hypothetical protein